MNTINFGINTANNFAREVQDLYAHAPPIYDVAIGVFRAIVQASVASCIAAAISNITDSPKSESTHPFPYIPVTILGALYLYSKEISSNIRTCRLNKLCDDQSKNDVVLVCLGSSDWNGAINGQSPQTLQIFKDLSKTHSIVIKKVSTLNDINEEIDKISEQGRKIKTFWLCGHGEPDSISLGAEELIGKDRVYGFGRIGMAARVDNIHFDKMDPEADIVVASCSIGGIPRIADGLNVAEWIQFFAGPKRRVFAPICDLPNWGIDRTQTETGSTYKFRNSWSDITSDLTYENVVIKMKKDILVKKPETFFEHTCAFFSKQKRSIDYKSLLPPECQ